MPKVTKLSQEQMDDFLAEIMASNISEKSAEFAKMLIQGNAWMARQLELGQLSIAKLRKLFQIQGSEKALNRKPKTDNRTAGKCIAEIMALRDANLDPPIMMCDALPANIPQGISEDLYILCFCLVHARRQFYELPKGYDDLADKVIGLIGAIYDHEAYTKGYSPEKRLAYHPAIPAIKKSLAK